VLLTQLLLQLLRPLTLLWIRLMPLTLLLLQRLLLMLLFLHTLLLLLLLLLHLPFTLLLLSPWAVSLATSSRSVPKAAPSHLLIIAAAPEAACLEWTRGHSSARRTNICSNNHVIKLLLSLNAHSTLRSLEQGLQTRRSCLHTHRGSARPP